MGTHANALNLLTNFVTKDKIFYNFGNYIFSQI